ncbi:MAG TPA: L,D-transpeptidase [Ktedonobacterales bacterium]
MATDGAPTGTPAQRSRHTLRNLTIISLLVTVVLIATGGFVATKYFNQHENTLRGIVTSANSNSPRLQSSLHGDVNKNGTGVPDLIPSCDCTGTSYTMKSLQLSGQGKEILVSVGKQELFAYLDGVLQFQFDVVTGRPELPSPIGHWSVSYKATNITFTSPWPPGSPFYYYPTHINYALLYHDGGFYLHDAWWRESFGPGSNVYHTNPDGSHETGSHGCVGMTLANAAKLYDWTPVGTSVILTPN